MILTEELYNRIIKKYPDTAFFDQIDYEEYLVKDRLLNKIGNWIVIIDYHN